MLPRSKGPLPKVFLKCHACMVLRMHTDSDVKSVSALKMTFKMLIVNSILRIMGS